MLQRILKEYDVVIIKSCYPNSAIASNDALDALKEHYRSVMAFFAAQQNKRLGIVTTPPLLAAKTNQQEALRARKLADWLTTNDFGKHVSVFDFYGLLANPKTNTLRKDYQKLWTKIGIRDSHPNKKANRAIAPQFVEWLAGMQ